jgi:hypothetical protein
MINKIKILCLLLALGTPAMLSAKGIEVVVIGISQGGSPAFEETMDKKLREKLSNYQELFIADYPQTRFYRRKINFDESPVVSTKLLESLKQYCTDTTVFVWGEVKKCSMKGVRKNFIFGYIKGELTISLNIFSMRNKNFTFSGDVTAEFEKKKEMVFFGAAEDEIIPSTIDKTEIMGNLLDKCAQNSANLISTVIKSERLHAAKAGSANASVSDTANETKAVNKSSADSISASKNKAGKVKDDAIDK